MLIIYLLVITEWFYLNKKIHLEMRIFLERLFNRHLMLSFGNKKFSHKYFSLTQLICKAIIKLYYYKKNILMYQKNSRVQSHKFDNILSLCLFFWINKKGAGSVFMNSPQLTNETQTATHKVTHPTNSAHPHTHSQTIYAYTYRRLRKHR